MNPEKTLRIRISWYWAGEVVLAAGVAAGIGKCERLIRDHTEVGDNRLRSQRELQRPLRDGFRRIVAVPAAAYIEQSLVVLRVIGFRSRAYRTARGGR